MPSLRLPIFDQSLFQQPIEQQVKTLADFIMRYRRELEYLLNGQLDDDNGVFKADVIISNTIITKNLYVEYGRIANLTVNELDTGWEKITNYLTSSTSDVNYIHINDQKAEWITASTTGSTTEHFEDKEGNPLYWTDDTYTGMGTKVTDYPVTVYVYTELVKATFSFDSVSGTYIPRIVLGAGTGTGDNGKGVIYKDTDELRVGYIHSTSGDPLELIGSNDGWRKSGGAGDIQLRNIAVVADAAAAETALESLDDGDLVVVEQTMQTFSSAGTIDRHGSNYIRATGSSSFNVTLPTDAQAGDVLYIKNRNTAGITLIGEVDVSTNYSMSYGRGLHIRYNGTEWDIISLFTGIEV